MIDTVALREKVLDLAIRGKLVPQDPNDEPASVLLERIRAQKQQMVKEGKLKAKDIKDDSIIFVGEDNLHYEKFADGTVKCIEDEIPFELPEGWAWCRLPFVGISELGKTLNGTKDVGIKVPYLCSINIYWDEIKLDKVKTTFFSNLETEKYQLKKGDLLICEGGESGRCFVWNADEKMYYQNALHRVRFFDKINPWFFKYVLESYHFTGILDDFCSGVTIKHLVKSALCSILFPLPPVNEQNRIISSINNLLNLISDINSNKIDLEICVENIKSKILDLAVRGKLVPQDPNDEPAFVLLERIRAEKEELIKQGKIKRDKKESIIFKGEDNSYYLNDGSGDINITNDLPFDISSSWRWAQIKDVFIVNPRNKLDDELDVSFVPMPLIDDGYSGKHTAEVRKWKNIKTGFTHFSEGDVGVAKISPCFENLKSTVFENLSNGYGAGTTELYILRPYKDTILARYLLMYIKSDYFIRNGKQTCTGDVGQQRVRKDYVESAYFPIPPLNEQHRIVEAIETAFSQLDAIAESLN